MASWEIRMTMTISENRYGYLQVVGCCLMFYLRRVLLKAVGSSTSQRSLFVMGCHMWMQ